MTTQTLEQDKSKTHTTKSRKNTKTPEAQEKTQHTNKTRKMQNVIARTEKRNCEDQNRIKAKQTHQQE